jgi:hypothetical protein
MKVLRSIAVTAAAICGTTLVGTFPAAAAPVGSCHGQYELRTVESLQREAVTAPPSFFTDTDVNGDGYLCNKYLPEASSSVGIVWDNKHKIKK